MFESILASINAWEIGIVVSIAMMALTRFIPNEKLYNITYKLGKSLTLFGTLKLGKPWQKFEDFIINSIGSLYNGFSDGLSHDNKEK